MEARCSSCRYLRTFRRLRRWLLVTLIGLSTAPGVALAETLIPVKTFGSNPGNLEMFKYIPPALPASAPLVVLLHGCTQRAAEFAETSGWLEMAPRWNVALLLPEQQPGNNPRRCFNWFNGFAFSDWWSWGEWGSDQDRDEGEALSIKQMVDRMKADHGIDPRRVYVAGLSGGGAMAAVMLAAYPEVFAGGAIFAGVPYRCAETAAEALSICGIDLTGLGLSHIVDLRAEQWARRVRAASDYEGPWPRVSIWHGEKDRTVNPKDADALALQWTAVHKLDPAPVTMDEINAARHKAYRDEAGRVVVESYEIPGMMHGVPVSPGSAPDQCGRAGKHSFAVGLCAPYYVGKFWGLADD